MGGASRVTDVSLVLLRPLAVLLIGLLLALAGSASHLRYRGPLLILGLLALTIAVQLVPLPPSLWAHLPMSATYRDALEITGLDNRWRPLSIAPDLTVNSLLALLPPLAVLLGVAVFHQRHDPYRLLTWVLAGMVFSALLGLAQFVGGENSGLYFWRDRSEAVADGVFANRNHQAAFLACGLALLGAWIIQPDGRQRLPSGQELRRGWKSGGGPGLTTRACIGGLTAILLLTTVIATGSRTGTILAIIGLCYSYWMVLRAPVIINLLAAAPRPVRNVLHWSWLVVPLLLGTMVLAGRAVTFERVVSTDASGDQRLRSWSTMLKMLEHVFPAGSGYGTFDILFRTFEPAPNLHFGYFNHAHNDYLEFLLNGGLAAGLVMVAAAGWWGFLTARVFSTRSGSPYLVLGRSAAFALLLIALASLVDYPVRTPLISCLIMILAAWLGDGARRGPATSRPDQLLRND